MTEEKKVNKILTDEELEQATGGCLIGEIIDSAKDALSCKKSYVPVICDFCKNYKTKKINVREDQVSCSSNHWKPRTLTRSSEY